MALRSEDSGGSMRLEPQRGDFVRVRSRRWLGEDEPAIDGLKALRLACVDDDAQGETAEVLWDAELDGEILGDEGWASVARPAPTVRPAPSQCRVAPAIREAQPRRWK